MRKLFVFFLALNIIAGITALAAQATDWEESGETWEEEYEETWEDDSEAYGGPFGEGPAAKRYAKVATQKGTLNMRLAMKDNAKIVAKLPRNSIVTILEDEEEWTKVLYKGKTGYVKNSFLEEISELPFTPFVKGDKGDKVYAFKKAMFKLGYLKSDEINLSFDTAMVNALTKLQLINEVALNPEVVSPEVQALMDWGLIKKAKTGPLAVETDEESGLTVTIFCWDVDGYLLEEDKAVRLSITYAAQATGGQPPYSITVKKAVSRSGEQFADEVENPFTHIWSNTTEYIYIYAVATDAAGNTVTACAPFRYLMPARYRD